MKVLLSVGITKLIAEKSAVTINIFFVPIYLLLSQENIEALSNKRKSYRNTKLAKTKRNKAIERKCPYLIAVNRIDDFIKPCMVRGWVVNQIDVNNRFEIYTKSEEEIDFK